MAAKKIPSIFLSHTSADNTFAGRLGRALQDNGVRVWIDEAEIKVGDSLIVKVGQGIKTMEYLAVILSPRSVRSDWVQKEVAIATTEEINGNRVKVLPILYKECEIPAFLLDKVYADFRSRARFQPSLIKLLDAILPEGFQEHILEAVRKAIRVEFEAYRHMPTLHLSEINKCFTKTGSAREKIIEMLELHRERGWILTNPRNSSTADLLDIKLRKVEENRAYVETKEFWNLRWYDPHLKRDAYFYRKTSRQSYILLRDAKGVWRVEVNVYPGYIGPVRGVL